jgi:mRNA interferase RelE/StbE
MIFKVEYTGEAVKTLKKLDNSIRSILIAWIEKNLVDCENPRIKGSPLQANHKGKWRYRIGDYRLICNINDNTVTILILSIGHRSEIYKP